jgi:TPR repeat protein/serine/threonine protein kinase
VAKGGTAGEGGGAAGAAGPEHYFALPAGTKIFEFEIASVLGHGGFGITYKALDTDLQKTVAIKEFFPNDLAGRASSVTVRAKSSALGQEFQQGLKAFLEEARLIARFQHPNIVGVQRFFEAHGTGYIVFTYETGQTLSQRLATGSLPEAELRQMLEGVLAGLEVVHEAAILHRDLKPNNIMLRTNGTPVLIDFGAARDFQHRHSRTVTAIASAGYAPPEQYGVGGQQGPWSDFYALGAIAYRCVTGVTPTDSLRRLRNDPLKPVVEAARGKYDAGLLRTIDWMLRVEEADRPVSVAQVRAALAGGAIPERKGGQGEQVILQERPRRRGLMWLAAGGLIAAVSASAVAGVMFGGPEQIKALTCTHAGLWCGDRLAMANVPDKGPAEQAATTPTGPPPQSQSSSVKQELTSMPTVSATVPPVAVGSPPSASGPQSSGPAASLPGSNSSPSASLSSPAPDRSAGPPTANAEQTAKPPGPALSEAAEAWAATKDTSSIPVLETFSARYKDTFYAEMAGARIAELKKQQVAANMPPPTPAPDETAWAKIKDGKDPEQLRAFLKQFPDSSQQAVAIARLATLEPKVTDCDELAADPADERKIADVPGVRAPLLDAAKATPACERATTEFPDALRLQYQLGRAHEKAKNYQEARHSYTRAAEQGYPAAMAELGDVYRYAQGVPRDYEEARRWYNKGIEAGSATAMVNLGDLHRLGNGVSRDHAQAHRWYLRAADLGNAHGMYRIGNLYSNGDGVTKDLAEMRRWYLKAAERGSASATNDLGWVYETGEGVAKDYAEARNWYDKAARLGVTLAMANLGNLYAKGGYGLQRDPGEARRWFVKAAELGSISGMNRLHSFYTKEKASQSDWDQLRQWYEKAAISGNKGAHCSIGQMYVRGEGVKKDEREARHWFQKGADLGNASCMFDLGYSYAERVPVDFGEARRWYTKAADLGNMAAMNNLGVMHGKGLGGRQDNAEAFRLYKKSAELGNAVAMHNLAWFYANGRGVQRDYSEARRWMTKAADLGYEKAKADLGRLGR